VDLVDNLLDQAVLLVVADLVLMQAVLAHQVKALRVAQEAQTVLLTTLVVAAEVLVLLVLMQLQATAVTAVRVLQALFLELQLIILAEAVEQELLQGQEQQGQVVLEAAELVLLVEMLLAQQLILAVVAVQQEIPLHRVEQVALELS
jgi:hypothetical protein